MRKTAFLLLALLQAVFLQAAVIDVTSNADSGPGTLREAVSVAAAGDMIRFTISGTIVLSSGSITINKNLSFDGQANTVIIDGGGASRLFSLSFNTQVSFRNLIMQNGATGTGDGGAVFSTATANFVNCTFRNNSAGRGGAVFAAAGNTRFVNCSFLQNQGTQGGALNTQGNLNTLVNCLFFNNQASVGGGAILNGNGATATIIQSTITGNSSPGDGGGILNFAQNSKLNLFNSIVAGNTGAGGPDIQNNSSTAVNAAHNLLGDPQGSGITAGTGGNISGDPLFANIPAGDFSLQNNSPAANAGNNAHLPADELDADGDNNLTEKIDISLDGSPRVHACIPDLGAIENQNAPLVTVSGGSINCSNPSATLSTSTNAAGLSFSWSGPGGFTSTAQNPGVSAGGTYALTVTATSGCTATATATVTEDSAPPDISVSGGGTIDDLNPTTTINVTSATPGVTFSWSGPNNFSSTQPSPLVSEPGTYTATVTAPNGCTNTGAVEVIRNSLLPPTSLFSFSVINRTATFTDQSTGSPISWQWDFGDGNTANIQNPVHTYQSDGDYTACLTVSNTEGSDNSCQTVSISIPAGNIVTFEPDSITGQPGDVISIPVRVKNFIDVISFQMSIHIRDRNVGRITGVSNFGLPQLDQENFFLTNDTLLTTVWFNEIGVTLADDTEIFTVEVELTGTEDGCTDLFLDGTPTPLEVGVIDANGAISSAATQLNAGKACILSRVNISGRIYFETGNPLDEVIVECTGVDPAITDANGNYAFSGLPAAADYLIRPHLNTNPLDGVTSIDLALIVRHIQTVELLNSPYKIIAADVDHSGLVGGIDLAILRQLILSRISAFPDQDAWRFVDAKFVFPDPARPLASPFPEAADLSNLRQDTTGVDFIAVKLGDVNNTAMGLTGPSGGNMDLLLREVRGQGKTRIEFRAADVQQIAAYQFDIQFDPEQMELTGIIPGKLPGLNESFFGTQRIREGIISTLWYDPNGDPLGWPIDPEEVLFSLDFRLLGGDTPLAQRIRTGEQVLQAAGYSGTGEELNIRTSYAEDLSTASGPEPAGAALLGVSPNPFSERTSVRFFLPEAAGVQLLIRDALGREVKNISDRFGAGTHQIDIPAAELPGPGWYYLCLRSRDLSEIRTVIRK